MVRLLPPAMCFSVSPLEDLTCAKLLFFERAWGEQSKSIAKYAFSELGRQKVLLRAPASPESMYLHHSPSPYFGRDRQGHSRTFLNQYVRVRKGVYSSRYC